MFKKSVLFAVIALSINTVCAKEYVEKAFLAAAKSDNVKEITNLLKHVINPEILDKGLKKAAKRGFTKACAIISPKATIIGNDVAIKKAATRGFQSTCSILVSQASVQGSNKALKRAAKRGFREVCKIISPYANDLGRIQARAKLLKLYAPDTIDSENLLPEFTA